MEFNHPNEILTTITPRNISKGTYCKQCAIANAC